MTFSSTPASLAVLGTTAQTPVAAPREEKTTSPIKSAFYKVRREVTRHNRALKSQADAKRILQEDQSNCINIARLRLHLENAGKQDNAESVSHITGLLANAPAPNTAAVAGYERATFAAKATQAGLTQATGRLWHEVAQILKNDDTTQLAEAARRALYCHKHEQADTPMMESLLGKFEILKGVDERLARRVVRLVLANAEDGSALKTQAQTIAKANKISPTRSRQPTSAQPQALAA